MSRSGALALAAAALGSVVAAAVPAASLGAAPPGFVTLVDDTGVLSVAVPAEWADVDTAPGTNNDGTPMPWISASTDFAAYQSGFDVPGAVLAAVTYTTDLQMWVDQLGEVSTCPSGSVDPYDAAGFVGLDARAEGCGAGGQATLRTIVANLGADTTRTYLVQLQSPTPADLTVADQVLASVSVNPAGAASGGGATGDDGAAAPAPGAPAAAPPGASLPPAVSPPAAITLPDGSPLAPVPPPGQGGQAAAPTTAAGGPAVFAPTNEIAAGALRLIDDTRTISVAVPPDWAQAVTAPAAGDPAGPLPQVVASPDLAGFGAPGAFTTAGVRYTARPYVADTAAAVGAAAAALPCTAGVVQPYADPVFTGHIVQLTDCGGTPTRVYLVAASPASQTMTAVLHIQVTDPDDADLQTILSTFNVDPAAPAPGTATPAPTTTAPATTAPLPPAAPTTVPAAPGATLPALTAPPTTASGAAPTTVASEVFTPTAAFPDDTVRVIDDTGLLRVGVPPTWTDRQTTPISWEGGITVPYIAASPDISEFIHDPASGPDPYAVPGVIYVGLPYTADTAGAIPQFVEGEDCTPGPLQVYQDPVFTGHIQQYTACGGAQTRVFVVVANPADASFTAVLLVQVTDDPAVLNTVLATFNYDATAPRPGTAPAVTATTTTAAAPAVTTALATTTTIG